MRANYTPHIKEMLLHHGITNDSEIKYCVNRISRAFRGKSCCDNFRMSVSGNNDAEYKAQKDSGCCGSYDELIKLNSGTTVRFGFNYGH